MHVCKRPKKGRSAAIVRFIEHHTVELKQQLCMGNQHGFFEIIKSVQLEETRKVNSQDVPL